MSLPRPRPGLVIRYSFLWSHEARAGATEGRKERPACIVVATRVEASSELRVVVSPITHEPPDDRASSLEIPARVARMLGLDTGRHWLRFDELNAFTWPGFDLRSVPEHPGMFDYGMLPRALFEKLRSGILERQRARSVAIIPRD